MNRTPTLQSLSLRARDYFGEDGYPFEESIPSSLDVVVACYGAGTDPQDEGTRINAALRRHLEIRGRPAMPADVDDFTEAAITYLRAIDPDQDLVNDANERRALSHLFWGYLVAARPALDGPGLPDSHSHLPHIRRTVKHTITCSCGEELTSQDEEMLYSFVRAHVAQQHAPTSRGFSSEAARPPTGSTAPEVIVQRWQDEVVNRGDLEAIDDLSPAGPAEELKEQITVLRTAFPDLRVTTEDMVVGVEEVALRSTLEGTHQGPYRGVAPTGKQVSVESYEFFRIEDDKIVEHRSSVEEVRLLQQLGVLPV